MHEAILYTKAEGHAVDCALCSHRCHIPDGARGLCRLRENRGGTLYSLIYGRLCARQMDPIEKKPLYHFLPGTSSYSIATPGCNFRCSFCQNWHISQIDADRAIGALAEADPVAEVAEAARHGAATIAYTYTEPTIFMEFALDCARLAHRRGIRNVFVTNGFQTPEAVQAMTGLIDAANVDLKAYTDEFYRRYCKGRLEPVKQSIGNMHAAGIHVEVTTLLIPGRNDAPEELRALTAFLAGVSPDIPWHISRFHPDYQETALPPTPLETMQTAERIGREAGLHYVYLGNVWPGEGQCTRCPDCGRMLVKRSGYGSPTIEMTEPRCPNCGRHVAIVLK